MIIGLWEYDREVILAAVILDLLIGDPRWFPHPVVYIGSLIEALEKVLRRLVRNEWLGGVLLLIMTVGITCGVAVAFLKGAYSVNPYLGFSVALLLSWSCLAARSLHRESRLVADALGRGDLATARKRLSFIVGRDTAGLRRTGDLAGDRGDGGGEHFRWRDCTPLLPHHRRADPRPCLQGGEYTRFHGGVQERALPKALAGPRRDSTIWRTSFRRGSRGCSWSLPRRCSDFRRGMHGGSCAATGATTPPPTAASPKRPLPGRSASDSAEPASTPVRGWRSRPSVIR